MQDLFQIQEAHQGKIPKKYPRWREECDGNPIKE